MLKKNITFLFLSALLSTPHIYTVPEIHLATPPEGQIVAVWGGPMFGGKSQAMIKKGKELKSLGNGVAAFKHRLDNRRSKNNIDSKTGESFSAIAITNPAEIMHHVKAGDNNIILDEAQFFGEESRLLNVLDYLTRKKGKDVYVAGLDLDFKREPFGLMPQIMAQAANVTKLTAECQSCGGKATLSQRLVNGKPANYNDPVVVVGAEETYEPRCINCHELPGVPTYDFDNEK